MARNSYSAGKRQRERDKEKKRKAKAARLQNRGDSGGGIPVATVDEIQGGLMSIEEVLQVAAGGGRPDGEEQKSGVPSRLFVGGLDWRVTSEQLKEFFEGIGPVSDAFVVKDRDTGDSRGFGFVTMDRKDAAAAIEKLNGESLEGRALVVRPATERK
jgi:RNA recognition motif-containing protein